MMSDPNLLPSIDEILSGQSQCGVPRPAILDRDEEVDTSVQRVGSSPVPIAADRSAPLVSRWQVIKQLLRIIFTGKDGR